MTPEVGTVGHRFVVDLEKHVVQIERIRKRGSGRNVPSGQVENLCLLLRRKKVAEADFVGSADHAVRLHAAQLALLNLNRLAFAVPANDSAGNSNGNAHAYFKVDAAAHDFLRLCLAEVNRADTQFVSVRMRVNRRNHADNHILETLSEIFHVLHLDGVHRQVVRELREVRVVGKTNIIFNPG